MPDEVLWGYLSDPQIVHLYLDQQRGSKMILPACTYSANEWQSGEMQTLHFVGSLDQASSHAVIRAMKLFLDIQTAQEPLI